MKEPPPRTGKGRFVNPHIHNIRRKRRDFFLWMVGFYRDYPFEKAPRGFSYPVPELTFDDTKPTASWMGHSTYLISVGGKNILTDPIWSRWCSPVPLTGPRRKRPAPIPLSKLPKIDYVLISHDHYDHLDRPTVDRLHALFTDILWVVPTGVKKWFESRGIKNVAELSWWEEIHADSAFRITCVPSQHFSGRLTKNLNRTLWGGYVVESLLLDKVLYFVGDTGYNKYHFKEIGEAFPKIDLSLIPIGSYSPRKFMAPVHIEPKDAVKIHLDVNSKLSLGMHWKTFRLSEEPMDQPPFDLLRAMKKKNLDPHTFLAVNPGQKINW